MYYIGVDGGGTKTAFGLFNEEGICIEKIELSTCHFLQVGYEQCAYIIQKGIKTILTNHPIQKNDLKIGIGIAGYGNDPIICHEIEEHLKAALSSYRYVITNDIHIALIGALNGQDGITVVAGTGSIAMAQIHKKVSRCGGWGHQLGDEGSGYWIGKQLLKEFCYQADKRHPQDEIYDAIMDYYNLTNPYQLISTVNHFKNERSEIAQLSILCHHLSRQNHICEDIMARGGEMAAELIKGLLPLFQEKVLVTYHGSVFHDTLFKESFQLSLPESVQFIEPVYNALVGAYLYAYMS